MTISYFSQPMIFHSYNSSRSDDWILAKYKLNTYFNSFPNTLLLISTHSTSRTHFSTQYHSHNSLIFKRAIETHSLQKKKKTVNTPKIQAEHLDTLDSSTISYQIRRNQADSLVKGGTEAYTSFILSYNSITKVSKSVVDP